jgi:recombination protein RecT
MSNALQIVSGDIYAAKSAFESVLVDRSINFEREAGFAIQVLQANDYALGLAMKNRQSVVDAVTNIAAIGLSLNPAKKQAYLVPRDGKICLDVSYIGLIELAIQSGSIKWAQAAVVHMHDSFQLQGLDKLPIHHFNPFSKDRGEIVGVYVVAKTADGDYLTESMSIDDINAIRDRSSAWKAWVERKRSCPWVTDWSEMARKTVVKRASKYWPKTDRLDQAVHHMNTDGGEGIATVVDAAPKMSTFSADSWIARVETATDEATLMEMYRQAINEAKEAKDLDGAARFKRHAVARRDLLRNPEVAQ